MSHATPDTPTTYGVMAEYDTGQQLLDAARQTMAKGFSRVEAYSPVPIEELNDVIHKTRTVLPKLILAGGLAGMAAGFGLQYWASVIAFPMNVGGRPLASWTTFIVPSYELTILLGSFGAIFGMLFMNRLPRLHHPLLKHGRFALVTHDKFFVVIETADPKFSETETRKLLEGAGSKLIQVVED